MLLPQQPADSRAGSATCSGLVMDVRFISVKAGVFIPRPLQLAARPQRPQQQRLPEAVVDAEARQLRRHQQRREVVKHGASTSP